MPEGDSTIVRRQFDELVAAYSGLKLARKKASTFIVWGELSFEGEYEGATLNDNYKIQIVIGKDYPNAPPILKEVGGRIPEYFHAFVDGRKCLGAPEEIRRKFDREPTLLGFVDNLVVPYLYSYSYWAKNGEMPYGELAHGGEGILEHYAEYFQCGGNNRQIAALRFLYILGDERIRGHERCPCGSGRPVRTCHFDDIVKMKMVQERQAFVDEAEFCAVYLENRGTKLPHFLSSKSQSVKHLNGRKGKSRRERASQVHPSRSAIEYSSKEKR